MTRDEALVRAALGAAAKQIESPDVDGKMLFGVRASMYIRALDPQAIIASVGPDAEIERLLHATMGLYESAKAVLERYDEFRDEDPTRNTVPAMENLRVALAAKQEPDPRDAEIERLRAELEQAHQVLDDANCPRKYVTQGGVTRCLYGTSSISAYDAPNAEIERLQAELQLVTSPRDSVGEVVSALRSEIERLRMSERTWMEEAMRSHDIIAQQQARIEELEALLRAGTFDPDGERVCVCHIVDGTWYCKVEAVLGWKEKS